MELKKNFSLIIALIIPILMILFLVAIVYIPRIYNHPQYNFLFVSGGNYNEEYIIQNGKLVARFNPSVPIDKLSYPEENINNEFLARLFVYDIKQNKAAEVTLEQAKAFNFYSDFESPDGYKIINGSSYNFIFGGASSDPFALYISGNGLSKKLNIPIQTSNRYDVNLRFVGWINPIDSSN